MRVDDDPVQSAAGAPACVDVNGTEVGDNFDDEFVGESEEGWKGHCRVLYLNHECINCEILGRLNFTLKAESGG
jgi:hypothetical protein